MEWKKIFNKGYDSKVSINLRGILKMMYRNSKADYENIVYKVTPDYDNNRIIITFKHQKE